LDLASAPGRYESFVDKMQQGAVQLLFAKVLEVEDIGDATHEAIVVSKKGF
jgi:hypothetical protein